MAVHVVRTQGVLALYNGLSASLTRQVIRLLFTKAFVAQEKCTGCLGKKNKTSWQKNTLQKLIMT